MKDNNISLIDLKNYNPTSKEFYNQFFKNSFKFYFKGVDGLDPVFDAIDAGDKYKEFKTGYDTFIAAQRSGALGRDFAKLLNSSRNLYQKVMYSDIVDVAIGAKNAMSNAATTFSGLAPLAKLNVVSSVVGAGLSGYETIDNIGKLIDAKGGKEKREAGGNLLQSSGEFFMNVGAGTAAFPGGQAVGAVLWGAGTIVKN